jgi:GT2 family glycosyltransferase
MREAAPPRADAPGVVVIGRNEGRRLVACLAALRPLGATVVYVDSGSSDGSAGAARGAVASVVELDPARPFSAARARNEGFAALSALRPDLTMVQFVDGDCNVDPGWLAAAARTLDADPGAAVVVGHLLERHPDASIYNRLCALEWRSPPGTIRDAGALGGIMAVRAEAFRALGGFDENVIAGEDSEFGVRTVAAGWTIRKIDAPMATHDADIHRFRQWWRRAVRSGHATAQRFHLNGRGPARDGARQRRSILVWGMALPALAIGLAWPTSGLSLLLFGLYGWLGLRIARFRRSRGDSPSESRLYARFTVLSKLAEAIGLLQFHWNRARGRYRIIEYK